jgi:TRAP-type uncharacterized transport system substrate-binding protein
MFHMHPFVRPSPIAAGSYPGQAAEITSVGSWSFIMARPDLPEEIGYKLALALHEAEPALAARLPQALETTSANTAIAAPDPLLIHPGVIEYLRRIGELA